jgi:hypothetical protein
MCRQRKFRPGAPPSLLDACGEFRRLQLDH